MMDTTDFSYRKHPKYFCTSHFPKHFMHRKAQLDTIDLYLYLKKKRKERKKKYSLASENILDINKSMQCFLL